MTLAEAVAYAQLLNVLLIPAVIWIVRLERTITKITEAIRAHAELDRQAFDNARRDIERVEDHAGAAHRRIDDLAARSAGGAA